MDELQLLRYVRKFYAFVIFLFYFFSLIVTASAEIPSEFYQRRIKEQEILKGLKVTESGHFSIYTPESFSHEVLTHIRRQAESAVSSIGGKYGYESREHYEVRIVPSSEYSEIDPADIHSAGFYQNKKIRIAWDPSLPVTDRILHFKKVFRHEFTHLVLSEITGNKLPRWLNEGLAEYEEREGYRHPGEGRAFYKSMIGRGRREALGSRFFVAGFAEEFTKHTDDFYQHSYILAKHLIESQGMDKLLRMFSEMKKGASFSAAYKDVYPKLPLTELADQAYQSA